MVDVARLQPRTHPGRSTGSARVLDRRWIVASLVVALAIVTVSSGFWRSEPRPSFVDRGEVTSEVDLGPGVSLTPTADGAHPGISAVAAFEARADHGRRPHEQGAPEVLFGLLHLDGSGDLGPSGVWVVLRHHVMLDPGATGDPAYVESLEVFDPVTGAPITTTMWTLA